MSPLIVPNPYTVAFGLAPGTPDGLLYTLLNNCLYSPAWVNADINTTDCSNAAYVNFKKLHADSAKEKHTESLRVTAYPNPSSGSFTISVNGVPVNSYMEMSIEAIDGTMIYRQSGNIPDGSGKYEFIWDAENVSSGLYFYSVRVNSGISYTGKMVKM